LANNPVIVNFCTATAPAAGFNFGLSSQFFSRIIPELESSHSPQVRAMSFARWRHHIRFASGFLMPPLTQW